MMKNIAMIMLLVVLLGCYGKEPERTGHNGKPLPSFDMLLADSVTYFNTSSIPRGKPVVLFLYGPSCPYSRAQMGEIIDEMQSLKDIRFYIFTTWPFHEMKSFCEHYQLKKYPNIIAGLDYTNFFGDYFKAQGVPYMAIYGKDKLLNEAFIGKIYGKQIKNIAEK